MPNETWHSDFTHYRLTTGADTGIITWLDEHSRRRCTSLRTRPHVTKNAPLHERCARCFLCHSILLQVGGVLWGEWGSNPRPTDYECSRTVRCADQYRRTSA
jgi:hypothetical protein